MIDESSSIDDGIRIVYTVKCRMGVWSIYRHGRALHRSRDVGRIGDLSGHLAASEALRTGQPVKTEFHYPETGEVTIHIVRPIPAEC
jgi:hypothetical protein